MTERDGDRGDKLTSLKKNIDTRGGITHQKINQAGHEETDHEPDQRRENQREQNLVQSTSLNRLGTGSHDHRAYHSTDQRMRGASWNAKIPGHEIPADGANEG